MKNKIYTKFIGQTTTAYDLLLYLKENFDFKIEAPIEVSKILDLLELNHNTKPNFSKIKLDGRISIENGEPLIWSNPMKTKTVERKRFTLAHELGHFMLHIAPFNNISESEGFEDKNISFNRDDNWDYKEMEANSFAAQLLMPSSLVTENIKKILEKDTNIERTTLIEILAEIFFVSPISMKYRLKNMGININQLRQDK